VSCPIKQNRLKEKSSSQQYKHYFFQLQGYGLLDTGCSLPF